MPRQLPQNRQPGARREAHERPDPAEHARTSFIDGMGRVGEFWGIAPAMGRIWAVLYLNQDPMTMDGVVTAVGITKGHALSLIHI